MQSLSGRARIKIQALLLQGIVHGLGFYGLSAGSDDRSFR
jgi:hypothetical protein